jgi:hypothetical protein
MRWMELMAYMGDMGNEYKFWSKIMQGRDHLGEPTVDKRSNINLEEVVCVSVWIELIWLKIGSSGRLF